MLLSNYHSFFILNPLNLKIFETLNIYVFRHNSLVMNNYKYIYIYIWELFFLRRITVSGMNRIVIQN